MKLPPILGKDIDGRLAELEGKQRTAARDHRERLVLAHCWGKHTQVIEGCPECQFDICVMLMAWQHVPHSEIPKGFVR